MMAAISTRRLAIAGRCFALSLLMCLCTPANAHGGGHSDDNDATVRAVLDPLPASLEGVRVQLRRTLAPQLLISNETRQPLTVFDDDGRAFLRIGSGQVEADLGAAAFHRSNTLMAPGAFAADASQAPNWQVVEPAPHWGWFDLRLRSSDVAVPDDIQRHGKRAQVGQWRVPVQLGDERTAITGRFEFVPEPQGIPEARVTATGPLASSTLVRAMNGSARSGVFVSYRGEQALLVYGAYDEPMLRFADSGVDVNRHSETWQQIAPAGAPNYIAGEDADWATVSTQPNYGWVDPRIGFVDEVAATDESVVLKRWSIPIQLGEQRATIDGITEWKPVTPLAKAE